MNITAGFYGFYFLENIKRLRLFCCQDSPPIVRRRTLTSRRRAYLVDVVGVGGSALQEHRGDPHVDESAMSPEWHQQTAVIMDASTQQITNIQQLRSQVKLRSSWMKKDRKHDAKRDATADTLRGEHPYVSKSDRLGSSDVWLKSPGSWKREKVEIVRKK